MTRAKPRVYATPFSRATIEAYQKLCAEICERDGHRWNRAGERCLRCRGRDGSPPVQAP